MVAACTLESHVRTLNSPIGDVPASKPSVGYLSCGGEATTIMRRCSTVVIRMVTWCRGTNHTHTISTMCAQRHTSAHASFVLTSPTHVYRFSSFLPISSHNLQTPKAWMNTFGEGVKERRVRGRSFVLPCRCPLPLVPTNMQPIWHLKQGQLSLTCQGSKANGCPGEGLITTYPPHS